MSEYQPRIKLNPTYLKQALVMAAGTYIGSGIDNSASTSPILRGHVSDAFLAAEVYAAGLMLFQKNNIRTVLLALNLACGLETGQALHVLPGRFNPIDYIAYGVGIVGLAAFNKGLNYMATRHTR